MGLGTPPQLVYLALMARMRREIEAGTFAAFRREYVAGYRTSAET